MRPYRKERIASSIRDIISDIIVRKLQDPRIDAMTTVTRVVMSGDLMVAKVHISVPGNEAAERRTFLAIQHAGGFIQRLVARELTLRQCPELRFEIDKAVKGVSKTMELLAQNRRRQPELFESEERNETDSGKGPADDGQGDRSTPQLP
ncbi:MAG: 30S ribosome-binding factor RbfA [Phycisphaerales bacterium]|nr:MAG: 30S ribosome-binding factor RbfA [Phycisphaerales bacterium]